MAESQREHETGPRIVAIGTSAGGLAALESFLQATPPKTGLSFVVVQHLSPDHESLAPEILAKHTAMPVREARNDVRIQANSVYTTPPGKYLTVQQGRFLVQPMPDRRVLQRPIDVFLQSLAEEQGERALCVILTGAGSDGAQGAHSVKAAGGVVIVQDPATAEFPSMPEQAALSAPADLKLAVADIPPELLRIANGQRPPEPIGPLVRSLVRDPAPNDIERIIDLLRDAGPFDFRGYKRGTLQRRIERRMALHGIERPGEYLAFLEARPEEVAKLGNDLLIHVTEFFRDAAAWEVLAQEVVPRLMPNDAKGPVRAWVAGCATGQEAYSLAILLCERRRHLGLDVDIRIFATDLDDEAIRIAREGTYAEATLAGVSEELRERYFTRSNEAFVVRDTLRKVISFATHDLLRDPPYSRLDFVSCRNLLIYLDAQAQARVIELFHAVLKTDGYLFLGSAETLLHEGFQAMVRKWRIYRRKPDLPGRPSRFPRVPLTDPIGVSVPRSPPRSAPSARPTLADLARDRLLERFAPGGVVVDRQGSIVTLTGDVGRYLVWPRGEPVMELARVTRKDLRARLRAAMQRCLGEERLVQARAKGQDGGPDVVLTVEPLKHSDLPAGLLLVTFQDAAGAGTPSEAVGARSLEDDLENVHADLQATVEAYEASTEELRAANEEMATVNEELRTANEEIETSREELQSLNEELNTVNDELKEKVSTLEALTSDLNNLLTSTEIPVLFLDRALRIRRFTPAMRRLANLLPTDVGRPLADITLGLQQAVLADAEKVLAGGKAIEGEMQAKDGSRFVRRIHPYRTLDGAVDGLVVAFHDVETIKRAQDRAEQAGAYAQAIVDTVRTPLLVLDGELRVVSANRPFYEVFQVDAEQTLGRRLLELGNGQWKVDELQRVLLTVLKDGGEVTDFEVQHTFDAIGERWVLLNARRLRQEGGGATRILLSIEDVTQTRRAMRQIQEMSVSRQERVRELAERNARLIEANETLDAFSYVVGHDLKEPVRAVETLLSFLIEDHGGLLPPEGQQMLTQARAANERLGRLVLGLLEFGRAARTDPSTLGPLDVRTTFDSAECQTRFAAAAAERGARIEPPAHGLAVLATGPSLSQILGNLVLNAIRHNSSAAPRIRVTAEVEDEGSVAVCVEDDGPGIPADVVALFQSGRFSTMAQGFGLTIAKRAAERLGGKIELDRSKDLGGALVRLRLQAATLPGQRPLEPMPLQA